MISEKNLTPLPLASALFGDQFSQLISAGVSLVRSLDILKEMPAPYGEASGELQRQIQAGKTPSEAMDEQPGLFSPFYRNMVRGGELGNILDETLAQAAVLMLKEWRLLRRVSPESGPYLLNASAFGQVPDWWNLSPDRQKVTLILFCEALRSMLLSGVPILRAMEYVATLLPAVQRDKMLEARDDVGKGEPINLSRLGILPRFAWELIDQGEKTGTLDRALERAAHIMEHEFECRRRVIAV